MDREVRKAIRTLAKAILQINAALYPTEQMDNKNREEVRKLTK